MSSFYIDFNLNHSPNYHLNALQLTPNTTNQLSQTDCEAQDVFSNYWATLSLSLSLSLSLTSLRHLGWWPTVGWGSRCGTPCYTRRTAAACERPASPRTHSKSKSDTRCRGQPCSAYTPAHSFLNPRTRRKHSFTHERLIYTYKFSHDFRCGSMSFGIRLNCPSAAESARAPGFSTW